MLSALADNSCEGTLAGASPLVWLAAPEDSGNDHHQLAHEGGHGLAVRIKVHVVHLSTGTFLTSGAQFNRR